MSATTFLLCLVLATASASATDLPEGFVHLRAIDPTIAQDIRYAGAENFTRGPVPGYRAAECILARPTAEALARVQQAVAAEGLTLLVYDCYRPARAVRAFVAWARSGSRTDPDYHPDVARNRLVSAGYIGARSGHSSGGSLDVTLARRAGERIRPLAMGTPFDFFGARSHTDAPGIASQARRNRHTLVAAMRRGGFSNYAREWWHFRHRDEPYPGQAFDFPVTSAR